MSDNPLDRLKPLLPPDAIPLWPPAPGWWLLFGTVIILGVVGGLLWRRRMPQVITLPVASLSTPQPWRELAIAELAQYPRPYGGQPAGPWLGQINALLKRLCLLEYPEEAVRTLSGRTWLDYLNTHCPQAGLGHWAILSEGLYRPDCRLGDKAIDGLYTAVATWIRDHV